MNRIYQLVWNRALSVLQVASELTSPATGGACGRSAAGALRRTRLAQACAAALVLGLGSAAMPAWAT